MVYPINKDPLSLARKSVPATEQDLCIGQDLLDTLRAHEEECVGMAANMIGFHKRIIVVNADGQLLLMFNPEILRTSGRYEDVYKRQVKNGAGSENRISDCIP